MDTPSTPQPVALVATPTPPVTRAAVTIGPRGLTPSDMDGLWRTAQAVAKSGLAPKGIDTPEAVFVAMEMGLELGLPLMASLQNIAVVNGRPTLWGDSQLAVVRATGEMEEFSEWYEQAGKRLARNPSTFDDATAAVCRVKRRGLEASETAFTVADAKRATLWGKAGTWSQYPARMLRFRARSFALRDQFGDALRGLLSTEEAQDIPQEVRPTSPARTVFAAPVQAAPVTAPVESAPAEVVEPRPVDVPLKTGGPTITHLADIVPAEREVNVSPRTGGPIITPDQQAIVEAIAEAGATFDDFRSWAERHSFAGAGGWEGVHDVPEAVAAKLAKSAKGLVAQLKAAL